MTPPLWYGGAYSGGAASGAVDWDTYANGIWWQPHFIDRDDGAALPRRNSIENYIRSHQLGTAVGDYTEYDMTALSYPIFDNKGNATDASISGWGDDSGRIVVSVRNAGTTVYTQGTEVPWGWALYSITDQEWKGYAEYSSTGSDRHFTTPAFITNNEHTGDSVILVSLSDDPGNSVAEWRDYDGPDDWDTWSDGVFKWAYSGLSYFKELKTPDIYNGTTGLIAFSRNGSYHGFRYNSNVVADAANTAPYLALWHIEGGTWKGYYPRQPLVDWFGTQNGSLYIPTNGPLSYGNTYIVVPLHREPTNFANWRDYDGPLYTGWDDPNWSYVGRAAGAGNDSSLGTYSIPTPFSEGSLIGCERHARNDSYQWTQYGLDIGNTDRYVTYGARYQVYFTQHAGWQRRGPVANQWNLGFAPTHPISLNYSTFYTYGPTVAFDSAEDPGQVDHWPDYDGPVANWDTYANGVYIIGTLNTSQNDLIPVPAYPASTYGVVPQRLRVFPMGNNRFVPQEPSNFGTYDGDEAPYVAIYITEEADTANAYDSSAKGWYVFKNDASSAVYNNTTYETPIAWPSDTSTSRPTPGVNEDGYLGSVNNEGTFVVFLDEYNDPLGAGGTDHWTRPPFVIYNDAPYVDSAAGKVYPDSAIAGGTPIIVNDELHADNYVQGMLRDSSSTQFRFYIESHSAYGVADVDIYNNGSLYATSTVNLGNATGSPVLTYIAPQSGFSGYPATAFDTGDGSTGYPIFIIVWTDTDKP